MDWVEIGDYQAARVCLQETPQTIERDLWISFCLCQCGDYSEALKHYAMIQQQAKQMDSAQAYGQLCLLKMYEKVKDAPKTKLGLQIQKVSDVLFSGNCSSADPIVLSYHYFHQGQHSKCLQSLREIKHHRQDLMTAMLLVEAGHLDKAMERLDRYEEQEGISAMSSNVRACSLYLSGQSMEAIQLLSPIAHAYPHHTLFRHNVALFQESSHQMQEWERCPHPQSQLNTALLHLQQDHPSTGLDVLQAINIYSPTVQYCKGAMAYEAASANALSMEDALAVLEEACQLPGKEGRLALAILKLHENKYEEALSLLDTSSTVYQQIACNRAQVLCRLEQYKDALECFDAIPMTQLLGEWPLLHGYVISLLHTGHIDQAVSLYQDHMDSPLSLLVLSTLANTCYRLTHYKEAADAFHLLCAVDHDLYWEGLCGAICGVIKSHLLSPSDASLESVHHVSHFITMYTGDDVDEIQSVLDALVGK